MPSEDANSPRIDSSFAIGQPVSELYRDPAGYDPSLELNAAVRVALLLGLPLLLTGEPGCGKTSVAHWLAWKMGYELLVYNVKSLSVGRDLLYDFDELARFRDIQLREHRSPMDYLRLNALGLAIFFSAAQDRFQEGTTLSELASRYDESLFSKRHVVLIDELDKAPRDTPNDLLMEIDQMKFRIRELDATIEGVPDLRPIVIITSNSEKSLPEPFLRRCVFHHIASPDDTRRKEIVARREHPFADRKQLFHQAMRYFDSLNVLSRAPGTAELLAWLTALEEEVKGLEKQKGIDSIKTLKGLMGSALGTLAKTKEDLELAERRLKEQGLG
jgi:MoxR-like ATPase